MCQASAIGQLRQHRVARVRDKIAAVGGYLGLTGVWRDFRVIPGKWQRGEKVFPLRVR
jgi:hypothetical protein